MACHHKGGAETGAGSIPRNPCSTLVLYANHLLQITRPIEIDSGYSEPKYNGKKSPQTFRFAGKSNSMDWRRYIHYRSGHMDDCFILLTRAWFAS
jgi:hypothetical protein